MQQLPVGTKVTSTKPPCSCKGANAPWETTTGVIRKVITNHTATWYFLSSGSTVKDEWITHIDDVAIGDIATLQQSGEPTVR